MAVSFLSGKVVYISSQAASLLRCKPERLQGALFSELLAPQDVSTFYSSTAPSRLPPWSSCAGTSMWKFLDCVNIVTKQRVEKLFLNQLQIIHKFLHGSNYCLVYFIMYSFVEAKYHSVVQ